MPIKVARQLRSSHSSGKVKVYLFAEDGELLRFKSRLVQLAKRCCRWIARHETDVHRRRVASGERIARHYVPQLRRLAQDHSDVKFESFRYGSLESLGGYRSVAAEEYVAALDEGAYRTVAEGGEELTQLCHRYDVLAPNINTTQ